VLLQRGVLLSGGLALAGWMPCPRAARAAAASDPPLALSPEQWQTLDAITARILPTDAEPGAREAGCVDFIDKALANEEAGARPLYAAGLAATDAAARTGFGRPFAGLAPAEQDALLERLEAGRAEGWPAEAPPSPVFFEAVRAHTVIGFLADPRYGGNRDCAGWRVCGYPGPRHHRGGYTPEQMSGEAPIEPIWAGRKPAPAPEGAGGPGVGKR
jgi:gluconate 2-dehydrogenase gamma chain